MILQPVLFIDAFAGISGDMFLGALSHCVEDMHLKEGVHQTLTGLPSRLGFQDTTLRIEEVKRRGIMARQVHITTPEEHHHRHLHQIEELLQKSELPTKVIQGAMKTFRLLAEAEGKIHGIEPAKVHFHEVGAVDSILDIVGTHLGIHELGIETVLCSPLPLSRGMTGMAHGMMPLPAPATVELLKGIPTCSLEVPFESVTPTGAALAVSLTSQFTSWPSMTVLGSGWGAGSKEGGELPNLLRLVVGETSQHLSSDEVWVLECQIDDMNPEFYEPLWNLVYEHGALDLYLTPVQMKKGRMGTLITLLVAAPHRHECEAVLLRHTTTFGVRRTLCERTILERELVQVETKYGSITLKVAPGMPGKAAPEAVEVKQAAAKAGVSMGEVYAAAMEAWRGKAT
jgi:uncharacterized protein (TIGR00299 family) protein